MDQLKTNVLDAFNLINYIKITIMEIAEALPNIKFKLNVINVSIIKIDESILNISADHHHNCINIWEYLAWLASRIQCANRDEHSVHANLVLGDHRASCSNLKRNHH